MPCKCAARMREYVLPYFGFGFKEDIKVWVNLNFADEDLRVIRDEDVEKHYTQLTTKMILEFGKHKFVSWAQKLGWTDMTSETVDEMAKETPSELRIGMPE